MDEFPSETFLTSLKETFSQRLLPHALCRDTAHTEGPRGRRCPHPSRIKATGSAHSWPTSLSPAMTGGSNAASEATRTLCFTETSENPGACTCIANAAENPGVCTQANTQVYASEAHADRDMNPDTSPCIGGNITSFSKGSQCLSYYGRMRQFPELHQAGL